MRQDGERFEDVECVGETNLALLCLVDGEEVWIPKSAVYDGSGVCEKGDIGTLVIPHWLAEDRGLV